MLAMHKLITERDRIFNSKSIALRLMVVATAMSPSRVVFKDLYLIGKDLQLVKQPSIGRDLRVLQVRRSQTTYGDRVTRYVRFLEI